ncbi:hypothetical protein HDV05_004231 [Chytridiales sp. JEL 0842]|nr:hypothetical protein HDV05_004231 [Chytridiales sp. JEL 0842]
MSTQLQVQEPTALSFSVQKEARNAEEQQVEKRILGTRVLESPEQKQHQDAESNSETSELQRQHSGSLNAPAGLLGRTPAPPTSAAPSNRGASGSPRKWGLGWVGSSRTKKPADQAAQQQQQQEQESPDISSNDDNAGAARGLKGFFKPKADAKPAEGDASASGTPKLPSFLKRSGSLTGKLFSNNNNSNNNNSNEESNNSNNPSSRRNSIAKQQQERASTTSRTSVSSRRSRTSSAGRFSISKFFGAGKDVDTNDDNDTNQENSGDASQNNRRSSKTTRRFSRVFGGVARSSLSTRAQQDENKQNDESDGSQNAAAAVVEPNPEAEQEAAENLLMLMNRLRDTPTSRPTSFIPSASDQKALQQQLAQQEQPSTSSKTPTRAISTSHETLQTARNLAATNAGSKQDPFFFAVKATYKGGSNSKLSGSNSSLGAGVSKKRSSYKSSSAQNLQKENKNEGQKELESGDSIGSSETTLQNSNMSNGGSIQSLQEPSSNNNILSLGSKGRSESTGDIKSPQQREQRGGGGVVGILKKRNPVDSSVNTLNGASRRDKCVSMSFEDGAGKKLDCSGNGADEEEDDDLPLSVSKDLVAMATTKSRRRVSFDNLQQGVH